jgi:tripartite-type tricarboxylate transporter receptor subunit TctC
LPDYPQVPTAREFGSSVAVEARFLILGTSALPPEVAAEFEKALLEVMSDPATREAIAARNLIAASKTGKVLADALNVEADNARAMFR